jgi:DNA-directed RNA polymerase subunit M/transcription elongation factor TFIIS
MEESRKKVYMLGLIAVLVISAGFITFLTMFNNSNHLNELKGQIVWLKCRNPECTYTSEKDMKEYYEELQNNLSSNARRVTALTCPKCGQRSLYEAVKCEKCGNIFFIDRYKRDYFDRCPKCGFSKEEKQRQEANK